MNNIEPKHLGVILVVIFGCFLTGASVTVIVLCKALGL